MMEGKISTKDEERKALEKIKQILDTLGENSYVATAFEGCVEDAEENIEDDFAFSMKGRVDAANAALEAERESAKNVKAALEQELKATKEVLEQEKATNSKLCKSLEASLKAELEPDLRNELIGHFKSLIADCANSMAKAMDDASMAVSDEYKVVNQDAFSSAMARFQCSKELSEKYNQYISRLMKGEKDDYLFQ